MPKYIGPYKIISCERENSHYTLALPDKLLKQRIHPTFHAKLLKPAVLNDNVCFPNQEATFFYDFGNDPEREWLIDSTTNSQKIQLILIYYGTLVKLHVNHSHTARTLPHLITTSNYMIKAVHKSFGRSQKIDKD